MAALRSLLHTRKYFSDVEVRKLIGLNHGRHLRHLILLDCSRKIKDHAKAEAHGSWRDKGMPFNAQRTPQKVILNMDTWPNLRRVQLMFVKQREKENYRQLPRKIE